MRNARKNTKVILFRSIGESIKLYSVVYRKLVSRKEKFFPDFFLATVLLKSD